MGVQARVEIQDVAQFCIDYIHNDLLGIIANAHLATADREPDVRGLNLGLTDRITPGIWYLPRGNQSSVKTSDATWR